MDDKKERERAFHNSVFTDKQRDRALPAYSILNGSTQLYHGFIREHARGRRLLEYGCGAAAAALISGAEASEIVGIDISDVAVQQAAAHAASAGVKATYHRMDAESLDFPNQSFDLICSAAILHHLELTRAYAEIARVLRPDGHAIFLEPLGHNPIINAYRRLTPDLRTPDEHPLLMPDLVLARQYFHQVDLRYFSLTTLAAIPLRRFGVFWPILRGLERLDNVLFTLMPWLRKQAWQVVVILSKPKGQSPTPEGV